MTTPPLNIVVSPEDVQPVLDGRCIDYTATNPTTGATIPVKLHAWGCSHNLEQVAA